LLEKTDNYSLIPMFLKIPKRFKNIKKGYIKKIILGSFFFFFIKGLLWITIIITAWFGFFQT